MKTIIIIPTSIILDNKMKKLELNIREAYKIDSLYKCFYVSEIIHNHFEYAIFGEITGFCYRGYFDEKSATDKVCSMNNPDLKNKTKGNLK